MIIPNETLDELIHILYVARRANIERSEATNDPHQISYYRGKADGITESAMELDRLRRSIEWRSK